MLAKVSFFYKQTVYIVAAQMQFTLEMQDVSSSEEQTSQNIRKIIVVVDCF